MKKMRLLSISILLLVIAAGCASNNHELIKAASSSSRQDVFQDIATGVAPLPGYADLRIYSSLKTHRPGIYKANDIHGTADYKIIINVDGQAAALRADLRREDSEAGFLPDPDAGEGMRYHFSKNIRLKAGIHKVVVAVPADDLAVERTITLTDGSSNSLTLEPVYGHAPAKRRPGFYGNTSFTEGLKGFRLILNDKTL